MEKNKYILQFSEDFKKIYERERGHFVWSDGVCQVILNTIPTKDGDDYVYEFETSHKLGCCLSFRANKITVNGKVIKNRYGETDYEMTDDEWAEIREHGKRNIEDFKNL